MRFLKLSKAMLYPIFGLLLTLGSAAALMIQFLEVQENDVIPDLFVGLDCDIKPLVIIEPDVLGVDQIRIHYPFDRQIRLGDGRPQWDSKCSRLVLFSHEELKNLGSEETEVRKVELQGLKTQIYVVRVDIKALIRRNTFDHLVTITMPSHWPKATRDTKVFRLYLQENTTLSSFPEVAAAFKDEAISKVTRQTFDLAFEGNYDRELVSSFPNVVQVSTVRHTGPFKSPPTRYESLIPVEKSLDSVVLTVRDNNIKARREIILVLISTLFGIGLTITVDAITRRLRLNT